MSLKVIDYLTELNDEVILLNLEGIMTALVTPLDADGSVNEDNLRNLIQFQMNKGVHSILVLGGTGEYLALSNEQRKQVIDIAVDEVDGKVPLVIGLLSPGINDNIYIGKYAKEAGADAYMAITPYYLSVTQQGFIEFYKKLDEAIDMPFLLYNYPAKTNSNIEPETVEKLVEEIPNVIGIKECTYNTGQFIDLLRRVGDKITVLSGEEYSALATMMLGAKGAVMASSNLVPSFWIELYNLIQNKKFDEAVKLNEKYFPLYKAVFMEANPGPMKYGLDLIGLPAGDVSTPLVKLSEETKKVMEKTIQELNITK